MDNPHKKYKPFSSIKIDNREWPSKIIESAPSWCSVDLRDGNQALIEPMGPERKNRMFELLCKIGFKEIEVGFPSASDTDFNFVRSLIENKKIPSDVNIQVLTQSRSELIEKTFESLKGASKAVVHFYNSTSTLQRRVVFNQDKEGIKQIALKGAKQIKDLALKNPDTDWSFEYSPESFTGTELDYAAEVCDEVVETLKGINDNKIIINLPATVEMSSANIYGDQIEWMHKNLKNREHICLSLHPHNDRGTAVAAAEFGLMAGADRVEGTLFGNGERTGNVDIVTLALNMLTQGIDPRLDFSNINSVMREAEYCNQLPVHPRHPYAGDLVFTAFSGSHQDAIKKGFKAMKETNQYNWEVPYLPIDPADLGRSYEAVVRINSQSGKGGVAFLLEKDHGVSLPRRLQISMSQKIQRLADESGKEIMTSEIWDIFDQEFMRPKQGYAYLDHRSSTTGSNHNLSIKMLLNNKEIEMEGAGNGPIDSFINALASQNIKLKVSDYNQSAISSGSDAKAAAYIELESNGKTSWGVGINSNTTRASFEAITVGLSKILNQN
ncbi:MAG: 2-isopropylmalate synthase [Gammaproteobacteria bacterium]|jgi:2-isopropylmalate synthase|nr:2-isopropylmalate synthase [Gammaproteobacteria bacterium]MDG1248634.1 2-isopropylmalate synthase [SAR86 cluster bacterium]|tara:strand:- start:2977 stop:4635 length:1659 start_codon:yes stop_codon:yes gene_type:complete